MALGLDVLRGRGWCGIRCNSKYSRALSGNEIVAADSFYPQRRTDSCLVRGRGRPSRPGSRKYLRNQGAGKSSASQIH
jgi:hypothetical protein